MCAERLGFTTFLEWQLLTESDYLSGQMDRLTQVRPKVVSGLENIQGGHICIDDWRSNSRWVKMAAREYALDKK